MPSLQIQFFALPEETFSFLEHLDVVDSCWKVLMAFSPEFVLYSYPPGGPWVSSFDGQDRVCLTMNAPMLPASSAYGSLAQNPDAAVIDIGRHAESFLLQSTFNARANDPVALGNWQRVAKAIKAETKAGMWAVDPETKKKSFYKIFRYSTGAALLSREGGQLRPAAGSSILSV